MVRLTLILSGLLTCAASAHAWSLLGSNGRQPLDHQVIISSIECKAGQYGRVRGRILYLAGAGTSTSFVKTMPAIECFAMKQRLETEAPGAQQFSATLRGEGEFIAFTERVRITRLDSLNDIHAFGQTFAEAK